MGYTGVPPIAPDGIALWGDEHLLVTAGAQGEMVQGYISTDGWETMTLHPFSYQTMNGSAAIIMREGTPYVLNTHVIDLLTAVPRDTFELEMVTITDFSHGSSVVASLTASLVMCLCLMLY